MADGDRDDMTELGDDAKGRQRGGSPSAISGALKKDPQPGPQHWGGPRPRRADPDRFFPRKFPRLSPKDP
ncbi:hypothetical protein [Nocardiopsis sp. B62]|uniref:hypothetical protein n=1 Tax=Nocardiopsis sp. B62 TaxID=2824874 RepID=UPI001B37302C|nr:hypothetical protein [Nocardiopsis sp. B62]MBQ1081206.1 hypothetical protein [Nocardiopsis sp. B62]